MDQEKLNAIRKVMEDIKDLSDLGEVNNDAQINFIAQMMKVVLLAANDVNHAELMGLHIVNFLNELEMLNGERTVAEHFKAEAICQN